MKQAGCCHGCSLKRLTFLLIGTLVVREIPFRPEKLMAELLAGKSTTKETDEMFELFRDNDTTTCLIAGMPVKGVPDALGKFFKSNAPTKKFCALWKDHLEAEGFELLAPDKLVSLERFPPKVAILPRPMSYETYNLIKNDDTTEFVFDDDMILHGRKQKMWETEFIHDVGWSFVISPAEFYIFSAFYGAEKSSTYHSPDFGEIVASMDADTTPYSSSGPLMRALTVAECFSQLHLRADTYTVKGSFAETSPPIFGLMSRFPPGLKPLKTRPAVGTLVESAGKSLIQLGDAYWVIDGDNTIENWSKICHGVCCDPKPLEKLKSRGISIKRTHRI